ncbi:hypothetical protein, partial [Klebsiella pneumoniae]|uniref:hypothetical protein n=1 Tax=Klebsiella pneumoniae TaxID=573 RepID=UPI0019532536
AATAGREAEIVSLRMPFAAFDNLKLFSVDEMIWSVIEPDDDLSGGQSSAATWQNNLKSRTCPFHRTYPLCRLGTHHS